MQLTPRYDDAPVIRIDLDLGDVAATLAQQRRRLVAELSTLEPAQWAHPTRCDDWTVTDVVAHLAGTTRFWNASISGGAAGTPTRYLDGFDPATTPGDLVAGMGELSPEVALEMLDGEGKELAGRKNFRDGGEGPFKAPNVDEDVCGDHHVITGRLHRRPSDKFVQVGND